MIGKGYWSGFMKRNRHRLNLVRPYKSGLDRTNWYKYGAFCDIYDSIEMSLIEAKVMKNRNGKSRMVTVLNLNHIHMALK